MLNLLTHKESGCLYNNYVNQTKANVIIINLCKISLIIKINLFSNIK
jgi:hypothetical protein